MAKDLHGLMTVNAMSNYTSIIGHTSARAVERASREWMLLIDIVGIHPFYIRQALILISRYSQIRRRARLPKSTRRCLKFRYYRLRWTQLRFHDTWAWQRNVWLLDYLCATCLRWQRKTRTRQLGNGRCADVASRIRFSPWLETQIPTSSSIPST